MKIEINDHTLKRDRTWLMHIDTKKNTLLGVFLMQIIIILNQIEL